MLCNQLRHTTSQDLKVLYTELIFIDMLNTLYIQIYPVVYFLQVTIVQKQEFISEYHRGLFITERTCIIRAWMGIHFMEMLS